MHSLLLITFILGLVEGLTEFLPISSTGHMILIGNIFCFTGDKAKTCEIIIQLGSSLAILIIFWRRLLSLIGIHFVHVPYDGVSNKRLRLGHIILGISPVLVLGLICYEQIKNIFEPRYVMYALVGGGLLLLISELFKPKLPCTLGIDDLTYMQAFIIGCFQCLALWPGFSRSGATISAGLLVGVSRCAASTFSFILAVPVLLCATVLDLYLSLPFIVWQDLPIFMIGLITAFIVTLLTIKFFLKIVKRVSFIPFAIYRFILAVVAYWMLN